MRVQKNVIVRTWNFRTSTKAAHSFVGVPAVISGGCAKLCISGRKPVYRGKGERDRGR